MKTWEIYWAECPTNYQPPRVSLVEAETQQEAYDLLSDEIKRRGIASWALIHPTRTIREIREFVPTKAEGKVVRL